MKAKRRRAGSGAILAVLLLGVDGGEVGTDDAWLGCGGITVMTTG